MKSRLVPYTIRIKMFTLVTLAALVMVINDRIYTFFEDSSHKGLFRDIVDGAVFAFSQDDTQSFLQRTSAIVGNLLATIASMMLTAVLGMAFMQIFWKRMRARVHTIAEINSAMSCNDHPFGIGSLKSWKSMFWLSAIPALGIANTQIILFASGSIHADSTPFLDSCDVLTVNLTNAILVGSGAVTTNLNTNSAQQQQAFNFSNAKAQVQGFVTQVIILDSVIPPFMITSDVDSYNVTFDAPALQCEDVSGTNISQVLPLPDPSQPDATIPIWNTNYSVPDTPSSNISFVTATRNLALASDGVTVVPDESQQQIVQCIFFNATFFVKVQLGDTGYDAFVKHNETVFNAPLTVGNSTADVVAHNNFLAIADTFAKLLNGSAAFDPVASDFTPQSPIIVFSLFGEEEPGVPWSLGSNDDPDSELTRALPELMDFVSVSLLSNFLNTGSGTSKSSSSKTKTNTALLSIVTRDCTLDSISFQYDRTRLYLSYSGGILYTTLVALAGVLAIRVNGAEESMDFSRILKSVVNEHLLEHKERLIDDETTLLADDKGFWVKVLETAHDGHRPSTISQV